MFPFLSCATLGVPTDYVISENTTRDYNGVEDAAIKSYFTEMDTNFSSAATFEMSKAAADDIQHTVIRFTGLSNLSGKTVNSAQLKVYLSSWPGASARTFTVRECTRAWSNTQVTWNNYSTGNAWQTAGGTGANDSSATIASLAEQETPGVWYTFSSTQLTQLVSDWVSGAKTNNGFLLMLENDSPTSWAIFESSEGTDTLRPILLVNAT